MRCLDAHQFREAVEVTNVPGCLGTFGNQVIKGSTDVDHHLTGGCCLKAVTGQLGHQNIHRVLSCRREGSDLNKWSLNDFSI